MFEYLLKQLYYPNYEEIYGVYPEGPSLWESLRNYDNIAALEDIQT